MLRKTKKLLLASREKLVCLALLPAFVLGTLPQIACICADGHREASCPMMRSEPQASCCQKQASPQRKCCKSCSSSNSEQAGKGGIAAQTGSCCHPVVEGPAAATVAKKGCAAEKSTLVGSIPPAFSLVSAADIWPTTAPAVDSTPPPRDVVIELSRLTI